MRRLLPAIVAVTLAATAAGCGSSGAAETPAACLAGVKGYLTALEAAPAPVRLAGTTPISDCLPDDQAVGDQEAVGEALVRAATLLNAEGERDPRGRAPVELGYLIAAVHEAVGTEAGIHADLLRRIDSAARFATGSTGADREFDLAYARGYAAGRSGG